MSARGPRSFDPVVLGAREADAWAAYYQREWRPFLAAAVGMVHEGFGMGPFGTVVGAYHVLRANQLWAPYPQNDADGARASMRRFYTLVGRVLDLEHLDPGRASVLEVEWWRLHRLHQHDHDLPERPLVQSLVDLYAYVYDVPGDEVRAAARHRVEAMDLSDAWVAGGRDDEALLGRVRESLVASYAALRAAVST